eukprot:jgi/Galph1/2857/GphlegSOOS_G1515.1
MDQMELDWDSKTFSPKEGLQDKPDEKRGISFWTYPLSSPSKAKFFDNVQKPTSTAVPLHENGEMQLRERTDKMDTCQGLDGIIHSKALAKRLQNLRVGNGLRRRNLYQKRLRRTLPWTWLSDIKGQQYSVLPNNSDIEHHSLKRLTSNEYDADNQISSSFGTPSRTALPTSTCFEKNALFLQRHLYLPYVIAGYLQLAFNVVIVGIIMISFIAVAWSIRGDIVGKVKEQTIEAQAIVDRCYHQYYDNKCNETAHIAPFLRSQCHSWSICMARDPRSIGTKTKLYAETLSEVLNSFVEPISYKTLLFALIFILGFTFISNLAFHFAKKRSSPPISFERPNSNGASDHLMRTPQAKALFAYSEDSPN